MERLQVFNYSGKNVRTVDNGGETWWVLKDVCDVLDIKNPSQMADRLDEDERAMFDIGRQGQANIINESGLYNVILRSDKPEAKPFKKWVTSEVLPSIRKHGLYAVDELIANPDLAIKALTALKEEREQRRLAEVEREKLKIELDYSKEWLSIKRVAAMNGINWKSVDWRRLKNASVRTGFGVKKIFDANYGEVNTYHMKAWETAYPNLEI